MKVLFVTLVKTDVGLAAGVVRKVYNQIEVLKSYGYEVDYTYIRGDDFFYSDSGDETVICKTKHIQGIVFLKALTRYIEKIYYDVVYIRHVGRIDPWLLKLLKVIKKNRSIILFELPTYPYENHAQNLMSRIDNIVNSIFQRGINKYVDRIVTFSNDESIFDIPTIRIMNGIMLQDISPVHPHNNSRDISLIAVSSMRRFHGYERVITGLREYYQNGGDRNFMLFLVGDGPEREFYERITAENHLNDHVFLCGRRGGEELNDLFEKCDLALSSFGWYKCRIQQSSALKVREYLAKGLPIISGGKEDVFIGQEKRFYLEFSNDDSPIDFERIVRFYDDLYPEGENCKMLREEIRQFAEESVSMRVTMEPIKKYIEFEMRKDGL